MAHDAQALGPRHSLKPLPQHVTWQEMLALWRTADEAAVFESIWNWDHFYPLAPPYDGPNLEGWTTLAALAMATSRIRIGSMVNGMHHRHPAVTANMAATLDHIAGGRLNLGLGAGWNTMESGAYGIPLGTPKERSDRFEEGVEVIVSLLANRETSFSGEYYHLDGAWCEPKPVQKHVPIVIGGRGRLRTLRTVARFADQWDMTFPEDPEEWVELSAVLDDHCAAVGRDPAGITRSIHLPFHPGTEPAPQVAKAVPFFEAGVDVVVWSCRATPTVAELESFAAALGEA